MATENLDIESSDDRPLCFVVGPIGQPGSTPYQNALWLLRGLIVPVVQDDCGYRVKRADQDPNPGSIRDALITDILDAKLVIADLTGANANAFYEVGLRHMTGKPIVHITEDAIEHLPFDNADQRTIRVMRNDFGAFEQAKTDLKLAVRATEAPGFEVQNPVTRARGIQNLSQSSDSRDQLFVDMEARVARLERQSEIGNNSSHNSVYAEQPNLIDFASTPQSGVISKRPAYFSSLLNSDERGRLQALSQQMSLSPSEKELALTASKQALLSEALVKAARELLNRYLY